MICCYLQGPAVVLKNLTLRMWLCVCNWEALTFHLFEYVHDGNCFPQRMRESSVLRFCTTQSNLRLELLFPSNRTTFVGYVVAVTRPCGVTVSVFWVKVATEVCIYPQLEVFAVIRS